jgi:hypothetical protein
MKAALLMFGSLLAAAPATKDAPRRCPAEKINFTKETGCRNDGYVEFCVPEGDKKLRAAIKRIAPSAENRGNQRCDENELLFFLPVDVESGSCVERRGAMTDKAWNQVCALASLPQIAGIRHTRFE